MSKWIHSESPAFSGFCLDEVVGYRTSGANGSSTEYLILLRGGHELCLQDRQIAEKIVDALKNYNAGKHTEIDPQTQKQTTPGLSLS